MVNIKVTFLNGDVLEITPDDVIVAWKSYEEKKFTQKDDINSDRPYAYNIFEDRADSLCSGELTALFGNCETFTLQRLMEKDITYKTSAIYTIENICDR